LYRVNWSEQKGRGRECMEKTRVKRGKEKGMFERKVGGRVEVGCRKDLLNSETPSHTTRPQRRKRRGTPNLNLETDRRLRITQVLYLQKDRDPQHARSHNNLSTQAFCGCLGHPSLYTKLTDNTEAQL